MLITESMPNIKSVIRSIEVFCLSHQSRDLRLKIVMNNYRNLSTKFEKIACNEVINAE